MAKGIVELLGRRGLSVFKPKRKEPMEKEKMTKQEQGGVVYNSRKMSFHVRQT